MLEQYKKFNKLPRAWPLIVKHLSWNDEKVNVLDVGCLVGTTLLKLNQMNYEPVGIDINNNYVKIARNYSQCPVYQMNANNLDFEDNYFDYILCTETLEHIHNQEKTLKEFYRVLKEEGRIFISVPNPFHLPRLFYPKHFVKAELLNGHVSVCDLTQYLTLFELANLTVIQWKGFPNKWIFPRWKRIGILLDKIIGKRINFFNRFKQNIFFELTKERM